MAAAKLTTALILLLLVAACAGSSQRAAVPGSLGSVCAPRTLGYKDAYADQKASRGRIYYASYTFSDCTTASGLGFEGEITQESVERLIRAYREDGRKDKTRFLVLNSPGGSVQAGLMLARFVITENLAAVVADNMICVSMCSFVFIAANKRIMGDGSRLGIHSASDIEGRARPETNYTLARLLSMVPGAHAEAYLSIANRTPPDSVTWLTAEEARALGFAD